MSKKKKKMGGIPTRAIWVDCAVGESLYCKNQCITDLICAFHLKMQEKRLGLQVLMCRLKAGSLGVLENYSTNYWKNCKVYFYRNLNSKSLRIH